MNDKNCYGILMKFPEPGKVKTRLAEEIGDKEAAETFRLIAERLMEATQPLQSEYARVLFYAPADRKEEFRRWFPGEELLAQKGDDIGEIMANALKDLFDRGASKAVITGSDIPDLDRGVLRQAFCELNNDEIVIGPATDGGYYLIGMRSLHEPVFRGLPWGTENVFHDTLSVIRRLKLTYKTVGTLSDVDTREDLLKM
ncbi:MAG: TIGR04282 family arsenosugar biosynthesis glycosyltransferase [Nitrospirae bacterium]|nr:TIGR04282 family arsenosugar biosynthesis glycosyltransferase [Nitrospirota bacterium]